MASSERRFTWLRKYCRGILFGHHQSRMRLANDCCAMVGLEFLERRVFLSATVELSSLLAFNGGDGTSGFVINGSDPNDESGYWVSTAGDVNGDGFDDLLIGAYRGDPNGNNSAGETYVVFGSGSGFLASLELSSLDGANGFVMNGIDINDSSGRSVSTAGDVNGDGFDDLVVGAKEAAPNGSSSGESYVVFGSGLSFPASLDLSSLDGTNGFVINGISDNDLSGYSVSVAGDVNGDGFDDFVIGARGAAPNGNNSGASYVVFGSDLGFLTSLDLSLLDGTNGFVINGADVGDFSGTTVSTAGDVNGDGFDDLAIGAIVADPNNKNAAGASYVVFGSGQGFDANLELSSLDGTNGFVINGVDAGDRSGGSVSSAGDMNGDGFDDVVIGAFLAGPLGNSARGESYVVFGSSQAFSSSLELSLLNGTNGFVINGIDALDFSGRSVSTAGDVNGDGFDDLIIGADRANPGNKIYAGESYVVFGSGQGFSSNLELSSLDGVNGFVINGIDIRDHSGHSVSTAGDVNGDGFDDLILAANGADPNSNSYAGESYVLFGRDFTGAVTQLGTDEFDNLIGNPSADILVAGQGDDLLVGNGGADVLIAGQGDDVLEIPDASFHRIEGGSGFDTLRVSAAAMVLDLTTLSDNKLTQIEQIDLFGTGDHTLILNVLEVLNISDTSNTLTVIVDAGDTVDRGLGWVAADTVVIEGRLFDVFTSGAATLMISNNTTPFVAQRTIFYNNSSFDGNDASQNTNDNTAIATDKVALGPGETASFTNYTSYSRGINGIMVDIGNATNNGSISATDFTFKVSVDGNVWSDATAPMSVTVQPLASSSNRVTIIWSDNKIENQWLEVTVIANMQTTGLSSADVFYFGNAIGESGDRQGDSELPAHAIVDVFDLSAVRDNVSLTRTTPEEIDNPYDFNRDQRVDVFDVIAVLDHSTNGETALSLITAPSLASSPLPLSSMQPLVALAPSVEPILDEPISIATDSATRLSKRIGRLAGWCLTDVDRDRSRIADHHGRPGANQRLLLSGLLEGSDDGLDQGWL